MNSRHTYLAAFLCLAATSSRARADEGEVDVRSFEYVDVVETSDGSIWKGVVVEQTPNVQYKIVTSDGSLHVIKAADVLKMSKQKNREWRGAAQALPAPGANTNNTMVQPRGNGVGSVYEPSSGGGLPKPMAQSGMRLDPSFDFVFPSGDIGKGLDTSFAPDVRAGYEALFGNFGIGGGGMARFVYWQLPKNGFGADPNNAMWTLETGAYGRAALHISRAVLFGGVSLGVDTNYAHAGATNMTKTDVGFGMNLQTGVEIAASELLGLRLLFDYHPGTDSTEFVNTTNGDHLSMSYYTLGLGASLRL